MELQYGAVLERQFVSEFECWYNAQKQSFDQIGLNRDFCLTVYQKTILEKRRIGESDISILKDLREANQTYRLSVLEEK